MKNCLSILSTFLILHATSQGYLSQRLGVYKSHQVVVNEVVISTSYGNVKVSALQDDVIHIIIVKDKFREKANYAVLEDSTITFDQIKDEKDYLILETASLTIKIRKRPINFAFLDKNGRVINQDDEMGVRWIGDQVTNYKTLFDGEKFIGL